MSRHLRIWRNTVLFAATLSFSLHAVASESNGYYRHPSISKDTIVFTSEGDLWRVPITGGNALRLTTHAAEETHPVVSGDGQWIAFTANYNGGAEVYVMPSSGGAPKQISYEGARAIPQAWTSGNKLIYSAPSELGPLRHDVLYLIDPETNQRQAIPLSDANQATLSDDGTTLYFVRGGIHLTNDNARHYRGGNTATIWKWSVGSAQEAVQISPKTNRSFRHPMTWNNTIYMVSDDDGIDNLWSMTVDGGQLKKLTHHTVYEVKSPTLSEGKIAYQHGADIRVFNLESNEDMLLSVKLLSDFEQTRKRWIANPLDFLTHVSLSLDGEQVALTARGNPIVASNTPLRKMPVMLPENAIASATQFSLDGQSLYVITDQSGEEEIWHYPINPMDKPSKLTSDKPGQRWSLKLSPDGVWLAHDNSKGELRLLNTKTRVDHKIDDGANVLAFEFPDLVWSNDSRYIAYSKPNNNRGIPQIVLHEISTGKTSVVTNDKYESFSPSFSADGEWLYFLSNRHFKATPSSPWGDRNMGPHFDKRTEAFAIALSVSARFPFSPHNELSKPIAPKKSEDKKQETQLSKKNGSNEPKTKSIEFAELSQRIYRVPIPAANYTSIATGADRLYLLEKVDEDNSALKTVSIANDNPKLELFFENVGTFQLSVSRNKIAVVKAQNSKTTAIYIFDAGAKASTELDKAQVQLNGWKLPIDPRQEWQQMFLDAWRMQRDFLYDVNMRGVDWPKAKDRYLPLLSRIHSRQELDDVLSQMNAELGVLHSQLRNGDTRKDLEQVNVSALGAVFEANSKGYVIQHIYRGDRDLIGDRSPLDMPNVPVQEGDIITHVNGQRVNVNSPIQMPLMQQQGQQTRLDYDRDGKSKTTIVLPIDSRKNALLKYADWERQSLNKVTSSSNGKVGYVHLRAMGGADIAAFARDFYSQVDKDAIIVDVRRNNGGNIDSWIVQQFLRETWAFWAPTGVRPYWNMQQTFRGHVAFLIDEYTYSDGETFAAAVKSLGLGPLIGKRTTGAGVWLSDRNTLVDGGMARAAEFAQYRADGKWIIEGIGVAPDIEIDNMPYTTFQGGDAQLEEGIRYLTQKLRTHPISKPDIGPLTPIGTPAVDVEPLVKH